MFGIRIAIGAVDNTTKATRDIAQKLQKFGSKVNSLINLGGMVIAFRKVGQAIDKAFNASTYSKEWGAFKDTFSQGFAEVAGRVADSWGPMLTTAQSWAETIVGAFETMVEKIQYAGAYMGALLSGDGFSGAAKIAEETVEAMRKATEERKKQQALEKQGAAKPAQSASQMAKSIAQAELDALRESGGDTSYSRAPATMKQRAAARMASATGGDPLDYAGRGLNGRLKRNKGFGYRGMGGERTQTAFEAGISGMGSDELEELAMGSLGGLRAVSKNARAEAKKARKMERMIAEARGRQARGVKLSSRMQAALAVDTARERESRDSQRAQNVADAVANLDNRVEQIAQELVGSGAGGK